MAVVRYLVQDVDEALAIKGPGGKQALLEDPSGNPVEIFQPRVEGGASAKRGATR